MALGLPPLTSEQQREVAIRIKAQKPDWDSKKIAETMGLATRTVQRYLQPRKLGDGPQWVDVNQIEYDFRTDDIGFQPGMLLEIDEGGGKTREYLVGHINSSNGGCGCCGGVPYGAMILRYKRIWEAPK